MPEATMASAPGASRQAIQHHYDVANEFYALWLDESMTYSSALWEGDDDTLEAAQRRKQQFHMDTARVNGARRVLDVGCGWGGLLHEVANTPSVERAVGLTLSAKQTAYAREKWPSLEIREESWWDHNPAENYDAIVSVGAFEHFATPDQSDRDKVEGYREFFRRCHRWLAPGSHISLQTITYENSDRADFSDFFKNDIFPESDLPRLRDITAASEYLFEIVVLRADRMHYARTLGEWRQRLHRARTEAIDLVGEATVARYDKYLAMSMVGFHVGATNLLRLGLRRIDRPRHH